MIGPMDKKLVEMKFPSKAKNIRGFESPQYDNPFDKFANNRKKHEVLNRKVKGEDRNVGRARSKVNLLRIIWFLLHN